MGYLHVQGPFPPLPPPSSTREQCLPPPSQQEEQGAAEPAGKLGREELTPNPTSGRGEKKKPTENYGSAARAEGGKRGSQRERRGAPEGERAELVAGRGRQWSTGQE